MFLLKTPAALRPAYHLEGDVQLEEIVTMGEYFTLDEAIGAAIKSGIDLEASFIEKSGFQHSVNDWISCQIAGGLCGAG